MERTADSAQQLLIQAQAGDVRAWDELVGQHRDRLRRMVEIRLDDRLRGRVDPSDVIQEALVEIVTRLPEYTAEPRMPFFLWLRLTVAQQLVNVHRHHLGTDKRDAGREEPLAGLGSLRGPAASSVAIAIRLQADQSSPSEAAVRIEQGQRLREAVESLDPLDREIVALRHFEMLDRGEAAAVLGISEAAAAKRHLRALKRLREVLANRGEGEVFQ